jgi:sacsin
MIPQVYNWTDSPSIVSRERLLILDPHIEGSEGPCRGGPVYDFVQNHQNAAIQNHMAAYQRVMDHFDRPLEGTIIRIPLRTQAQAGKSEISERATTVSEVAEVLRKFASEFGDCGLLFMRNAEKLKLRSSGLSIRIEMTDGETLRS